MTSPAEILRRHGLWAKKRFSQNFLHDPHVQAAIVRASGAEAGRTVIEIGAGLGAITRQLIDTGANVHAIERDRDMCEVLRQDFAEEPRFVLHEADAVRFDYASVGEPRPIIVGNLPYHLTGPLLFALLAHHEATERWILMVQKEVAQRLCARIGTKAYGGLTVVLERVRQIVPVIEAPRGAFFPAPRVDSSVVCLEPRATPRGEVADPVAFAAMVRTAFQQRRKTLANALSAVASRERALAWCAATGIDPKIRPERLRPEDFAALARAREAERA